MTSGFCLSLILMFSRGVMSEYSSAKQDSGREAHFVRSMTSHALRAPARSAAVWCESVAIALGDALSSPAAVVVRGDRGVEGCAGTTLDADGNGNSAWVERLQESDGQSGEALDASAGFSSEHSAGELGVAVDGETEECLGLDLLTGLLADVFAVRVGEPAARRRMLLRKLRPSHRGLAPLLAAGKSQTEIAGLLGKSPHTVHDNVKTIYKALGVHSRIEVAAAWHGFPLEDDGRV